MKLICAVCLLFLCPALSLHKRQSYEGLERKLKEVFTERAGILRQLSKTSNELDNIKGNLKSLKNGERVPKKDVQRILELSQKQREEMKSLQAALQKQLDEATERAAKQQATINFLKTEMERKSKIIKDLQQENKSLKNKLLSGNKLCGIHAEESKKIQAQLKELRYGKKDLIFKGQQLTDLEHKLTAAKEELEKASLDKDIPKILRIVTTNKTPLNTQLMKRENVQPKACQAEKQKSQQWPKVGNDIAKPSEDTEQAKGSEKNAQEEPHMKERSGTPAQL
ncbi:leucine zipper protein 2 isoform X3 [Conger conger]|uniref:leucine zipper protein 2 isoform X3 n=1 Tax=Conger conger TaxID=82655 RepID=UPI002A5ACF20|nr:leucine zipper protein 2 isoform X3 [Conger conger]